MMCLIIYATAIVFHELIIRLLQCLFDPKTTSAPGKLIRRMF